MTEHPIDLTITVDTRVCLTGLACHPERPSVEGATGTVTRVGPNYFIVALDGAAAGDEGVPVFKAQATRVD